MIYISYLMEIVKTVTQKHSCSLSQINNDYSKGRLLQGNFNVLTYLTDFIKPTVVIIYLGRMILCLGP